MITTVDEIKALPPGTRLQCPSPLGTTTYEWTWDGEKITDGRSRYLPEHVLLKYGPMEVKG